MKILLLIENVIYGAFSCEAILIISPLIAQTTAVKLAFKVSNSFA